MGGACFSQGGKEERQCVRMKRRRDGQGEEEMKVRRGDEGSFFSLFFLAIFANKGGADRGGTKNVPHPL